MLVPVRVRVMAKDHHKFKELLQLMVVMNARCERYENVLVCNTVAIGI